jgi:hypothetical protein
MKMGINISQDWLGNYNQNAQENFVSLLKNAVKQEFKITDVLINLADKVSENTYWVIYDDHEINNVTIRNKIECAYGCTNFYMYRSCHVLTTLMTLTINVVMNNGYIRRDERVHLDVLKPLT